MRTIKAIIIAICCIFLTTACSKKIMPPEIEIAGNVSEETDFTTPSSPNDFGSTGRSLDDGFFSEEPVLESGSNDSNSSNGSNGSNGSNDAYGSSSVNSRSNEESVNPWGANPFDGKSGSSNDEKYASSQSGISESGISESGISESGIQESKLRAFEASTNLKDIHFKFDQYDLDSDSRLILQRNAEFLKNNRDLHVEIQGHSDERGTNNYNIALGERRAHSTKKYLVSQGVDSNNVNVISYGEEKPFCFSSDETCWFQNRRAHFLVSK
jgi:peptidoglycan-associated lipoprotein